MLKSEQIRCGIYDSRISQRNRTRTPERTTIRYELELYHTGSGTSFVDGKAYPVRRGMLLCARPGQVRHSQLPVRSSYLWVEASGDVAWILEQLPVCSYVDDPEVVDRLLQLYDQLRGSLSDALPEPVGTVLRNRYVLELLQVCLQMCRGSDRSPIRARLVREAYRYMDAHYCERCSLGQIAQHIHVSANHLHTVFLHSEGKTPYEYVTEKRIRHAKSMILVGESSLAQIALETGFCSQSHFASVFKKVTGQTPARYRKELFDLTEK